MWTIARLAFKEILYKKIFLITILMSIAFLVFYGTATQFAAGKMFEGVGNPGMNDPYFLLRKNMLSTQLLGVGLYFASFITGLLAILSSVGSIASEIESRQIDTLLARPLHRRSIVLGKFVGLGGLLTVYACALFIGIILVNQLMGGPYMSVEVTLQQVLKAISLFALQPLLLVGVALLFSSMMTTINGGIILIILYGISFIGGFVEQIGVLTENDSLVNIGIVSSLIFPLDSLFRKMTIFLFDTADDPISFASQGLFGSISAPSSFMILYTILYGAAALWLAIRKFEARDV
ncbi:ABC transporter permease [Effusibacillus lacus]|uniref:ABC transporter permease n=1 Tax=Effusibacillus lacus TaxID=1348429 RepID=A0A292YHU4_9BACL|nr:ABC transporter permease subunit [Effusibacillus lacus]TCS74788.1 ABC-2 family transporter [Effusibacillus lacus]GAX88596.1 hypothetical protein EFBL_0208 [Effusibacillus lacus]